MFVKFSEQKTHKCATSKKHRTKITFCGVSTVGYEALSVPDSIQPPNDAQWLSVGRSSMFTAAHRGRLFLRSSRRCYVCTRNQKISFCLAANDGRCVPSLRPNDGNDDDDFAYLCVTLFRLLSFWLRMPFKRPARATQAKRPCSVYKTLAQSGAGAV